MQIIAMTVEEKRSRMLCHRCWLLGKQTQAIKMIDRPGSLHLAGYEDVVLKGIRLGICETCLVQLDVVRKGRGENHGEE